MAIVHITIRAINAHVPYMQAEAAEASDWLQGHVNDENYAIDGVRQGKPELRQVGFKCNFKAAPACGIFFSKCQTTPLSNSSII